MELGGGGEGNGSHRTAFPNSGNGKLPELVLPQPPKKSNGNSSSSSSGAGAVVREQDRFMPIANVVRIMRGILPAHAKISDDAKETMQECVSELISFITGEANERCQREQRKTVTAEDLLWAMSKLGFDDYIEPLTLYLHRHRQADGADKLKAAAAAAAGDDQFGKRSADYQPFPAPPLPLSPPPGHGQRHPPTGIFIPTPATPGSGYSTSSNNHGAPSFSVQKDGSGNA